MKSTRSHLTGALLLLGTLAGLGALAGGCEDSGPVIGPAPTGSARFTVTLTNLSTNDLLQPSAGMPQAVPLSPGVWVVHTNDNPLFTPGVPDRDQGLEALAEDGNPTPLAAGLQGQPGIVQVGTFTIPAGDATAGVLTPGKSYSFTFDAVAGQRLSLATMFVPSNDLFLAPEAAGIALFDAAQQAVVGDLTVQLSIWDAGTEANQEPGAGADQAPMQPGADVGPTDPNDIVRKVLDGFVYPPVTQILRLTLSTETIQPPPDVTQPPTGTGSTGTGSQP